MAEIVLMPPETSPPPSQKASVGPVGGLSTSDHARLKGSYPNGPFVGGGQPSSVQGAEPDIDSLETPVYREWYQDNVLNGDAPSKSDFAITPNLDFKHAPNIRKLTGPEDESSPGADGSTIVKSGIGPNVNVQSLNKDKDLVMVDPTYLNKFGTKIGQTPFVGDGKANPSETSAAQGKTKIGLLIKGKAPGS
jgi:hypothetical protein